MARHASSAVVAFVMLALGCRCSRDAPQPTPSADQQMMTPAAGHTPPGRIPERPASRKGMGPGMAPDDPRAPGMGHITPGMRCEHHFDAFDTDQDGKLSKEEFAVRPHRYDAGELFRERDRDHDNALTRAEFCAPEKYNQVPSQAP